MEGRREHREESRRALRAQMRAERGFGISRVRDIDVVRGIRRTSRHSSDAADDDEIDVVAISVRRIGLG
jgi:hypothetical protein